MTNIWKLVSELPKDFSDQVFLKRNDQEISLGVLGHDLHPESGDAYISFTMEGATLSVTVPGVKYCTLTDFIQDIERTKSELAILKAKVEKLIK